MDLVKNTLNQNNNLKAYISTYGCQMNVSDTERISSLLDMMGYEISPEANQADLIIINSCSVREKAVHKLRSEIGRYRPLKQDKTHLKIGVTGCVAQQEKIKLIKKIPSIDFVLGTDAIDLLPEVIKKSQSGEKKLVSARFEHQKEYQIQTLIRNHKVSAFVNITKGCDNFCTFCIVPFTRGRERSRKLEELVKDINSLYEKGVKEVTLLGQNVNSYKSTCGADFADLLEALSLRTKVSRIRYTTSHPKDFNEKLMKVMALYPEKLCEYIHLPVQSGNSEVLKRMNRGYTREEYLDKVKMIRRILPKSVLSTDIIVGFPGETDKQFEDTLSLLDEVSYEGIYSFKYSSRPFTKASRFKDQLSEEVKKKRLKILQKKQEEITLKIAQRYKNKTLEILVEKFDEKTKINSGRSPENKIVHFPSKRNLVGLMQKVFITEALGQTLKGLPSNFESSS